MTTTLRKLQIAFKSNLLNNKKNPLLNVHICQNGLIAEQRIQIYRNNVFITLTTVLKSIYPTIYQIIGESFFLIMAKEYIRRYPSNFGNVHSFGIYFGKFLANHPLTKSYIYLKEMAFLEWAYHIVYHEEKVEYFDINKLRKIPSEQYEKIKFRLNPACQLISCEYSILPMWLDYQEKKKRKTKREFQKTNEKILIIRRSFEVTFAKLKEEEFALLYAFKKGLAFKKACNLALKSDITFDVESYLKQSILQKVIVDFYF